MNKPLPFKDLNIVIPIIVPIKGVGFINQGSTLTLQRKQKHVANVAAAHASILTSNDVGAYFLPV